MKTLLASQTIHPTVLVHLLPPMQVESDLMFIIIALECRAGTSKVFKESTYCWYALLIMCVTDWFMFQMSRLKSILFGF